MAHFADVNEGALISAINSCKSSLNKGSAKELVADANAMPWDGADAKDNLIKGVGQIASSINSLAGALDAALNVANLIKQYKKQKEKVDKLKEELEALKSEINSIKSEKSSAYNRYRRLKDNPGTKGEASSSYNRYRSLGTKQIVKEKKYEEKQKKYKQEKEKLKTMGNNLAGMGYPPV